MGPGAALDAFISEAPHSRLGIGPDGEGRPGKYERVAVVARDHRSVLLRGPSERAWWLRNDALDVRVEPSVHFRDGRQRPSHQVVLSGHLHADKGGRVRWKLTAATEG